MSFAMALSTGLAEPLAQGWSQPRDVSVDGWRIDHMIDGALWAITVLFVIMCVWMLWACIAHGKKHKADFDAGDSKQWVWAKLGIAAGIFVFVDGVLFYHSYHDLETTIWNFEGPEDNPETVRIELNARQWNWEARYAGLDGKFNTPDDIVTINDMHAPVGATVLIQITAVDVLHSLYIPNLRVKQDAVPGMLTRVRVEGKEPGVYEVGCAQHCGANHYKMRGVYTVHTKEDFQRWLEQSSKDGVRQYNASDQESHWGWAWKKEI
jgi:cytochrome c oxidase subunit 2